MSVTAAARHVARAHDPTGHVTRVAPVEPGAPGSAVDSIQTAVSLVATFVPTSIVAAYIALTALIGDPQTTLALVVFFIFWALTPLAIVAATASSDVSGTLFLPKTWKELWPIGAAVIAFAAWAAAIPGSTLTAHASWLTAQVGGVIVVVASVVLGAVATLVTRSTRTPVTQQTPPAQPAPAPMTTPAPSAPRVRAGR
jgi:hypothetical protein